MIAPVRWGAGALAGAVALGLAACGSGGSSTTSLPGPFSITTGPDAANSSTQRTSTATTAAHPPHRAHPRARNPPGRAATGKTASKRAAPNPSTAPSGLLPTSGYGTYELCQGACTGSVPASLRRPLGIPADDGGPCPISLRADGPVSPGPGTPLGVSAFAGSDWMGARVTWTAAAGYTGPVLIRGRQIGGSGGAVGFGEGRTPYDELQLLDAGADAPRVAGGGRGWLTYTRVQGPGCYAYQVDGTSFTEVFVFRAA